MPFSMEVPLDHEEGKTANLAIAAAGLAVGLASFFSKPKTEQGKQLKEAGEVFGLGTGILALAFDAVDHFATKAKKIDSQGT